ncbi:MAG: sigma-70 family RNA polymerase sigma factor [Candidatus Hydrogenedentota bacterium]
MGKQTEKKATVSQVSHLRVLEKGESVPLEELGSEELMLEHGRGSENAFSLLVERHQKPVLNYIFRMVQNRQVAEEITQEVFLALVKNAHRYQPTAKFTTYLYTIASNMVSKEWLRRKRRPVLLSIFSNWGRSDSDGSTFHPLDHVADEKADTVSKYKRVEVSRAVNEALEHLPAHQREAFVLRRFQDLSYKEIAAITNVPVGTAKSRVVRAERGLRPYLERFREYVT